jgi:hypothetical protein
LTAGGINLLEKVGRMALLQDFYGGLLTDKQRRTLELYYDQNFSLGEISEQCAISRQGVHDLLRRSEKLLESYEVKLGLVNKFRENQGKIQEALVWLETLPKDGEGTLVIQRISRLLYDILDMEPVNE